VSDANFSRRRFLADGAAALAASWAAVRLPGIGGALSHARQAATSPVPPSYEFFTPAQGADIAAITAQIWPADDTPGAIEAGIPHFIDRVFATGADGSFADVNFAIYDEPVGADPVARSFAPLVQDGLAQLAVACRARAPASDGRLAALPGDQQHQVLTAIETTPFFRLLRRMTVVGLLADPAYGGNVAKGGWRSIGFEDRFLWQPPFGSYDR
jgi:gluconate 2-dehydrogenase gamma chain